MDADLQDNPEEIPNLFNKIVEGFDVVWARRENRKDSFYKRIRSIIFFKLFDYLAGTKTDPLTNTFSICRRNVIENFLRIREQNRSFTLFMRWLGFKQAKIGVKHGKRFEGESSYTLKLLIKLSVDYVIIYSNKPLIISMNVGFLIALFSFGFGAKLIYDRIFYSISVNGWASIMVSIYFIGGIILSSVGVLGLYLGKVLDETKHRPHFVVMEKIGRGL